MGGTGGGVDACFRREFFHARCVAEAGGDIRAAVGGYDGGIEKAAADVCRTRWRERTAGRRPAENLFTQAAQRALGNFANVKYREKAAEGRRSPRRWRKFLRIE